MDSQLQYIGIGIVFLSYIIGGHCDTVLGDFDNLIFGKTITFGAPVAVLFGLSTIECVKECLSRQHCQSLTYQRSSLQCRLFEILPKDEDIEDNASFVMTTVNQWSEGLISPCSRRTCEHWTKCEALPDGTTTCIPIDTISADWTMVLETDEQGHVMSGRRAYVLDAALAVASFRIEIPSWNMTVSVQTASTVSNDDILCVQSLHHIVKDTWDTFPASATRMFLQLCPSGKYHSAQHHLGSATRPTTPDKKGTIGLRWYIRTKGCRPGHQINPYYCTPNQTIVCGSIRDLISVLQEGADVGVHHNRIIVSSASEWETDQIDTVAIETVWRLEQKWPTGAFINQPKWSFKISSSDGRLHSFRRRVAIDSPGTFRNNQNDLVVYVDKCWSLAYHHDDMGVTVQESLDILMAYVMSGKRVRIVMNGTLGIEPDSLFVARGHISAQILGSVGKADITHFDFDAHWNWRILTTTGRLATTKITVGSGNNIGDANTTTSAVWYVDRRPWRRVLSISRTGTVTMGTKSLLITALKSGSSLRLVIRLVDNSTLIFSPDNIEYNNNDVAAQFIRYVEHQSVAGSAERYFPETPIWQLTMATTTGTLVSSFWVVGEHIPKGTTSESVDIDWFIS